MKRLELALCIGMAAAVLLSSFTAFAGECNSVREQVVRIHVLANSDSEEDQALKLAVRDAVLAEAGEIFAVSDSTAQTKALALAHLNQVRNAARKEIARQEYTYDVDAQLVRMFFDTRSYGQVTLPAGYYDAVRITIGTGQGQNWWCVMFPPICVPAATADQGGELRGQIASLGKTPQYKAKFAVVELVERLREKLSGEDQAASQASYEPAPTVNAAGAVSI